MSRFTTTTAPVRDLVTTTDTAANLPTRPMSVHYRDEDYSHFRFSGGKHGFDYDDAAVIGRYRSDVQALYGAPLVATGVDMGTSSHHQLKHIAHAGLEEDGDDRHQRLTSVATGGYTQPTWLDFIHTMTPVAGAIALIFGGLLMLLSFFIGNASEIAILTGITATGGLLVAGRDVIGRGVRNLSLGPATASRVRRLSKTLRYLDDDITVVEIPANHRRLARLSKRLASAHNQALRESDQVTLNEMDPVWSAYEQLTDALVHFEMSTDEGDIAHEDRLIDQAVTQMTEQLEQVLDNRRVRSRIVEQARGEIGAISSRQARAQLTQALGLDVEQSRS